MKVIGLPYSEVHLGRASVKTVMAQENYQSYRVVPNGSAGDWYWEVLFGGEVIARGLAATSSQARAQALDAAASRLVTQADTSTSPASPGYKGSLKTTTPRSSTTDM
jgi:hypothetical protein